MRRATRDLSRAAALPALQASATLKIESAEHAFNRIVADCAKICRTPSAPTLREPVPFPGKTSRIPEPQRLAA